MFNRVKLYSPFTKGTSRSRYLLPNTSFSSYELMTGGINNKYKGYTSEDTTQLQIEIQFAEPTIISMIHLSELNFTEGLIFNLTAELSSSNVALSYSQPAAETRPKLRRNYSIPVEEVTIDTLIIDITGFNGKLDIRQLVVTGETWESEKNYQWGAQLGLFNSNVKTSSNSSSYSRKNKGNKIHSLSFQTLTENNYLDLEQFLFNKDGGFCLFTILDNEQNQYLSFFSNIDVQTVGLQSHNINSLALSIEEVFSNGG